MPPLAGAATRRVASDRGELLAALRAESLGGGEEVGPAPAPGVAAALPHSWARVPRLRAATFSDEQAPQLHSFAVATEPTSRMRMPGAFSGLGVPTQSSWSTID